MKCLGTILHFLEKGVMMASEFYEEEGRLLYYSRTLKISLGRIFSVSYQTSLTLVL